MVEIASSDKTGLAMTEYARHYEERSDEVISSCLKRKHMGEIASPAKAGSQ